MNRQACSAGDAASATLTSRRVGRSHCLATVRSHTSSWEAAGMFVIYALFFPFFFLLQPVSSHKVFFAISVFCQVNII